MKERQPIRWHREDMSRPDENVPNDLWALYHARWSSKRTRNAAYWAATEIEILRRRCESLETEVYEWRATCGPGIDAEMVSRAMRDRGVLHVNLETD